MHIDKELINACLENDRLAQNSLYKLVFSYLMSHCIRYKKDYQTAGNSLNGIFLKILTHLGDYDVEGSSFQAWIKRIAVNQLIDEYRKEEREKKHLVFEEKLNSNELNHSSYDRQMLEMESEYLRRMISELPPKTAAVFNLYAIDGYKHKEIAEMLDISINTSKWHLSDARKKLQARLELEKNTIE
ncbi:MAG: RNA polymerase subunit sigma-24 [Flavobacteriales bacterium]|nr:RNA polymerase subunit sigma-24 [Flavobacteriales bacterium]|tara:strand:+ start:519 stop:1076 length:558 start_codon:yes stop_codon:yes gene_type:complete